ncbi:hypothetical protein [Streptomyces sp. NBC_00199]|nr:hypothetical protein [Streptomyces sp. NBC_00199]
MKGPHQAPPLPPRTCDGVRHTTRKDFVHGEDVTVADRTVPAEGLPRYRA